jgi:MFS family permease
MSTNTIEAASRPAPVSFLRRRELPTYPSRGARRGHLGLVVAVTVALYYALYVGGGVATLVLEELHMPFGTLVGILAIGNLMGAFASLGAGLCDRFGRANLVVYGLVIVVALTLFALPHAETPLLYGIETAAVALVEGVILVATPALIRDFSPQVGRATAMGFWTVGPVLGSLMVSLATTFTLPLTKTWQSQYVICGCVCLAIAIVAFLFLRELAPSLRDQLMVNEHDKALVEARARGIDPGHGPNLQAPFRQLIHLDIVGSAIGVSVLLLFYYTAVAFGTIYLVTVFHLSVASANALGNWAWGTNAVALIVAGVASDRLRVRKPFMLVGGIGALVFTIAYLSQAGGHPSWWTLVALSSGQSIMVAFAYATWMASFTETIEARNPALTATGLAIWGWIIRLVITAAFLAIPYVVDAVTPLIGAHHVLAELAKIQAAHGTPSPELMGQLAAIKRAAAEAPGQWRTWYAICCVGIVVFLASIFTMRGRWSPAAARADEAAHDAATARALAAMRQPAE